ncbi:amidohydrolase family protein [Streptomyces sp. NPDC058812]
MDANGIAAAVLPVSSPGVHFGDRRLVADAAARDLARHVNDSGAALVAARPDRFGLSASLPLPDVEGALEELARAYDELRTGAVALKTHYHGRYLSDPAFAPGLAELDARDAVITLHPSSPPGWQHTTPGRPRPMIEFPPLRHHPLRRRPHLERDTPTPPPYPLGHSACRSRPARTRTPGRLRLRPDRRGRRRTRRPRQPPLRPRRHTPFLSHSKACSNWPPPTGSSTAATSRSPRRTPPPWPPNCASARTCVTPDWTSPPTHPPRACSLDSPEHRDHRAPGTHRSPDLRPQAGDPAEPGSDRRIQHRVPTWHIELNLHTPAGPRPRSTWTWRRLPPHRLRRRCDGP